MDAVDDYIPEPERDQSTSLLLMPVEDVFSIQGRGTVATGRVERGIVRVGEEVEIVGIRETIQDDRNGCRNVPQAPRRGSGWRQRWLSPSWYQARRHRAWTGHL